MIDDKPSKALWSPEPKMVVPFIMPSIFFGVYNSK